MTARRARSAALLAAAGALDWPNSTASISQPRRRPRVVSRIPVGSGFPGAGRWLVIPSVSSFLRSPG
jgi:hypothetical protein